MFYGLCITPRPERSSQVHLPVIEGRETVQEATRDQNKLVAGVFGLFFLFEETTTGKFGWILEAYPAICKILEIWRTELRLVYWSESFGRCPQRCIAKSPWRWLARCDWLVAMFQKDQIFLFLSNMLPPLFWKGNSLNQFRETLLMPAAVLGYKRRDCPRGFKRRHGWGRWKVWNVYRSKSQLRKASCNIFDQRPCQTVQTHHFSKCARDLWRQTGKGQKPTGGVLWCGAFWTRIPDGCRELSKVKASPSFLIAALHQPALLLVSTLFNQVESSGCFRCRSLSSMNSSLAHWSLVIPSPSIWLPSTRVHNSFSIPRSAVGLGHRDHSPWGRPRGQTLFTPAGFSSFTKLPFKAISMLRQQNAGVHAHVHSTVASNNWNLRPKDVSFEDLRLTWRLACCTSRGAQSCLTPCSPWWLASKESTRRKSWQTHLGSGLFVFDRGLKDLNHINSCHLSLFVLCFVSGSWPMVLFLFVSGFDDFFYAWPKKRALWLEEMPSATESTFEWVWQQIAYIRWSSFSLCRELAKVPGCFALVRDKHREKRSERHLRNAFAVVPLSKSEEFGFEIQVPQLQMVDCVKQVNDLAAAVLVRRPFQKW